MELNYWTATEFEGGSYDEKHATLDRAAAARRRQPAHLAAAARRARDRRERHPERSRRFPTLDGFPRQGHPFQPVRRRRGLARQARARHRHRQQRRTTSRRICIGRRAGHAGAAQPDARHPVRAERAALYSLYGEGPAARRLRPDHHLGAPARWRSGRTSSRPRTRKPRSRAARGARSAKASGSTSARTAPAGSSSTSRAAAATTSTSAAPT